MDLSLLQMAGIISLKWQLYPLLTGSKEKCDRHGTSNYYSVGVNHDGTVYVLDNLSKKVLIFYDF